MNKQRKQEITQKIKSAQQMLNDYEDILDLERKIDALDILTLDKNCESGYGGIMIKSLIKFKAVLPKEALVRVANALKEWFVDQLVKLEAPYIEQDRIMELGQNTEKAKEEFLANKTPVDIQSLKSVENEPVKFNGVEEL